MAASAAPTREPMRDDSALVCCSATDSVTHATKNETATTHPAKSGDGWRTHDSR